METTRMGYIGYRIYGGLGEALGRLGTDLRNAGPSASKGALQTPRLGFRV